MNNKQDPSANVVIRICGSSGDGSIAAGQMLNVAAALMGYHIINFDSFPAEIRGFGKSCAHTRISAEPALTVGTRLDCLVALDDKHAISELASLGKGGIVIYDNRPADYHEENESVAGWIQPEMIGYGVPLRELSSTVTRTGRSRNIVSLGVLAGLFGFDPEAFRTGILRRFAGKSQAVKDGAIGSFDIGLKYALEEIEKRDSISFQCRTLPRGDDVEIVSGNEAAARACVDAGVRLYAGYPITPATKIMEILAKELPKHGGVVVQTEDEISAIGHVVGAGFAGERAVTATSGPGLALMSEMIGLAIMTEAPAVIINSQRGGPSTGLPTKTEQSDLNIAVFGGSGDSPRPVLAPTNVGECYEVTRKAFEIAEALQTPVIVLLDFFLSSRMEDVTWHDPSDRVYGAYLPRTAEPGPDGYRRFALTDSGISPRAVPGMDGLFHAVTGLEHDERGRPNYGRENHEAMTAKRFRKMESLLTQWPEPQAEGAEGDLDVGLISWGSSVGSARAAMAQLRERGLAVGGLFPRLIWPVHEEALRRFAARCRQVAVIEVNQMGQYANLVGRAIGSRPLQIARAAASPIPTVEIVEAMMEAL